MKSDKKWWKKGKSEMSASQDIKNKDIKKETMNEREIMKMACDSCDRVEEIEKKYAEQRGRKLIDEWKPGIPSIMKKMGFLNGDYNVTENIELVPSRKLYYTADLGPCPVKLCVTTKEMKFLFYEDRVHGFNGSLIQATQYLVLIELKCKICDMWETIPYVDDYTDSAYAESYSIKKKSDLGGVLHAFSKMMCHNCHTMLLEDIVDLKKCEGAKGGEE